MTEIPTPASPLHALADALSGALKAMYGRGPRVVRVHRAGPDAVLCVCEDVLGVAETGLVSLGRDDVVRDGRLALHDAHRADLQGLVERELGREVRAMVSGVNVRRDVTSDLYLLEPGDL